MSLENARVTVNLDGIDHVTTYKDNYIVGTIVSAANNESIQNEIFSEDDENDALKAFENDLRRVAWKHLLKHGKVSLND